MDAESTTELIARIETRLKTNRTMLDKLLREQGLLESARQAASVGEFPAVVLARLQCQGVELLGNPLMGYCIQ